MDHNRNGSNDQQNNDDRNHWENARDNWNRWEEEQEKKNWDRWNSNSSHNSYYNQPVHTPYDQGFANASMVLGLVSVTLCFCGLSVPFGALGILFAMLCKRRGQRLEGNSRIGLILSVIGIVLGVIFLLYMFYMLWNDPAYMNQLNQISQSAYGMDFKELLEQTYGISFGK